MNKTRKNIKRVVSIMLMSVILLSNFGVLVNASADDLQLSLIPEPDIDIVLTLGQTNVNATNFERDIRAELTRLGVKSTTVKVEAIETETTEANESNAVEVLGKWKSFAVNGSNSKPDDFYISGDRIVKSNNGNTRPASGYYDSAPGAYATQDAEYEFVWGIHPSQYGRFAHGEAGFLFRIQDEKNYYAYLNDNHSACGNIRIDGGEAIVKVVNGNFQIIAQNSFPRYYAGQSENMKIVTEGNNIKVYRNGSLRLNVNDNTYTSGSQGFYVWDQYGAYFSRIKLTTKSSKKFSEVIREPEWREGSLRFIVNLEDGEVGDFNNPSALGEILTRLINEEIHYVGWGTSINSTQSTNFITKNNGNGTFVNNNNYGQSIVSIASYIKSQIDLEGGDSQNVIVGNPIDIKVVPSRLATNTQTPEYPQGRWRIDHDYNFFENSLGQAPWADQWQRDLTMVFDRPGRYDISFEDRHPTPRYIYAHRRPIAEFSQNIVRSGSTYNVTFNDTSYDPDSESKPGKGIVAREWKYRNTLQTAWTNGRPTTLAAGAEYVVQLRVKDDYGAWSVPESKYISTGTSNISTPVASFNVSPNPLSKYQRLVVSDTSYDPAGKTISLRRWNVKKGSVSIQTDSNTLMTNFESRGAGEYTISLQVRNSTGDWSQTFSRRLVVTEDTEAPEAIVNPTSMNWTTKNVPIRVVYTDPGGSGFKHQRYAVTNSISVPSSGWSSYSSSAIRDVTISAEGRWYLHIEAYDNANNRMVQTMGEYMIDRTPPANPTLKSSNSSPTNKSITVSASYSLDSEQKLYKVGNGSWRSYTSPIVVDENTSVYAQAVDLAGNNSAVVELKVTNIDKIPPVLTVTGNLNTVADEELVLTARATDVGSGVKRIQLPAGAWVNSASATFKVVDNGSYTFNVEDNVGNTATQTVVVNNVNKLVKIDNMSIKNKTKDISNSGKNVEIISRDDFFVVVETSVSDRDTGDKISYVLDVKNSSGVTMDRSEGVIARAGLTGKINNTVWINDIRNKKNWPDDIYTAEMVVTDEGKSSAKSTLQFIVLRDKPGVPVINIVGDKATIFYPEHKILKGTMGSALSKEYSIGDASYGKYLGEVDLLGIKDGTSVYAKYTDINGNYSMAVKNYIKSTGPGDPNDPNNPPVDPNDPNNPPVDPNDPNNPPVDPNKPVYPGDPDDPVDPVVPVGPGGEDVNVMIEVGRVSDSTYINIRKNIGNKGISKHLLEFIKK